MHIRYDYPHAIVEWENVWIRLSDGARLAARIWLPEDAAAQPVPVILEYIPYRKNDDTAPRDSLQHPYFAGHGYAAVRVDMRGSGDSDGVLLDEYLPQEQDDALEVLTWLAAQPWCTGKVGIIGKSWGGFNGLQIAARRPPELGAIITVCSTDDRYADDVHYMGGCMLGAEMLSWASIMLAYNARPPEPRHVGARWREMWLERLAGSPPFVHAWVNHQRRDAFWKHGSVCEDFAAIQVPVYAVGGWADGYTNAIFRLMEGLDCPRKALVGPWAHLYPVSGVPGPAVGFLQECLRWWDHWLKGADTGIMAEPMIRAWIQESVPPRHFQVERPGRWAAAPSWPAPEVKPTRLYLNAAGLDATPAPPQLVTVGSVQTHGLDAGAWCAYGRLGDLPTDQRAEDGRALCFDSAPASVPQAILGFPAVTLTLRADQPLALVAVRLCDVAPDGTSLLVSRGLLNLTHRDSHEFPTALEPGREYTVTVRLDACGHELAAGHRWRVAVAPTYWPFAWPSPVPVTLTVATGAGTFLTLPQRPDQPADGALPDFDVPEVSPPLPVTVVVTGQAGRRQEVDVVSGRHVLTAVDDDGCIRFESNDGLEYASSATDIYSIVEGDPLSAQVRCLRKSEYRRDDWHVRIETDSVMSADATHFLLTNALDAYEGNVRVFSKRWDERIPRDLV